MAKNQLYSKLCKWMNYVFIFVLITNLNKQHYLKIVSFSMESEGFDKYDLETHFTKMNKTVDRIIFVDDDTIQHMINRKNLLRLKPELELFFFENPYAALEWLIKNKADLLILDVNMPEMRGWDFLDKLIASGIDLEVKMLTSSMDPEDIEISLRYRMVSGFLIKPLKNEIISEFLGL